MQRDRRVAHYLGCSYAEVLQLPLIEVVHAESAMDAERQAEELAK